MIEGVDYRYIYPAKDPTAVHVELLHGPYKETVFQYGKVKFEEKDENVYLLFSYDVIESKVSKPKKLEKDSDFKNHIGDLLVEIMSGNLEQEIIEEDASGTTDTEESNL